MPWMVFALAAALRLGTVDWALVNAAPARVYDGHEHAILAAIAGSPPDASAQAWPATLALYRAVGALLGPDPRVPIVLSCLAGAASVALLARAVREQWGPRAGLWAGLFAALLPAHLGFSTSPSNIVLPLLLVQLALRARPLAATSLGALSASLRPESALLLGLLRPRVALLPALVGLGWLAWGAPAALTPLVLTLRSNLPLLGFLGPPALLLALPGARDRAGRRTLFTVAALFTLSAAFADLGSRHLLAGGLLLCALAGRVAARWPLAGLIVLFNLSAHAADLAARWHARLRLAVPAPADLPAALPAGCVEVSEEPPIPGQPLPSHLAYLAGDIDAACVVWGREPWHEEWSSRGLADRARRMEALYTLTPLARVAVPGGPRVYFALTRR